MVWSAALPPRGSQVCGGQHEARHVHERLLRVVLQDGEARPLTWHLQRRRARLGACAERAMRTWAKLMWKYLSSAALGGS